MPQVLILLPALNEARSLGALLQRVRDCEIDRDVLVIDDGSTDNTAAVARSCGATFVIRHPTNLGIGGAVQTGMLFALRNEYDLLVRLDSDGQHPPEEIGRLIETLLARQADLVIGSRFLSSSGFRTSAPRRLGIGFLSALCRALTGSRFGDVTSGFRAYSRAALEALVVEYPSDYPEPDELVAAAKLGLVVKEVAVDMEERKNGRSSISGWRSVFYMAKVSLSMIMTWLRQVL